MHIAKEKATSAKPARVLKNEIKYKITLDEDQKK